MNCVLFVTLDPDVASTKVVDSRISLQTCAVFMPQTENAAADLPTLWVTCTDGSLVINHLNSSAVDRIYSMALIG
jgi:hypothetical protein